MEVGDDLPRCGWCLSTADYVHYHDHEWGVPVVDDHRLFEKIVLEGFQSGLSWLTILRKREAFREVFCGFDFDRVAHFGEQEVVAMLADARIVRHRGKIEAAIKNAGAACKMRDEFGALAEYFWRFVPAPSSRPKRITSEYLMANPQTPASAALAKDLKKRGWVFVGPTTAYAFMQAMGLVNDHVEGCHVRQKLEDLRRSMPGINDSV